MNEADEIQFIVDYNKALHALDNDQELLIEWVAVRGLTPELASEILQTPLT